MLSTRLPARPLLSASRERPATVLRDASPVVALARRFMSPDPHPRCRTPTTRTDRQHGRQVIYRVHAMNKSRSSPASSRPRAEAARHLLPHQAHRRPPGRGPDRPRLRGRLHGDLGQELRHEQALRAFRNGASRPDRHRRRRARHRRRRRTHRHQLPVPRRREDLHPPHRPHGPRGAFHFRRLGRYARAVAHLQAWAWVYHSGLHLPHLFTDLDISGHDRSPAAPAHALGLDSGPRRPGRLRSRSDGRGRGGRSEVAFG